MKKPSANWWLSCFCGRLLATLWRIPWIIGLVNAVANPSSAAEPAALLPAGVIHAHLARRHGLAGWGNGWPPIAAERISVKASVAHVFGDQGLLDQVDFTFPGEDVNAKRESRFSEFRPFGLKPGVVVLTLAKLRDVLPEALAKILCLADIDAPVRRVFDHVHARRVRR